MGLRFLPLLLLLASPLLGAEAVIDGPDSVRPGQFAVFDTTSSSIADGGTGFWIFDPDLPEDWQSSECNGVLSTAFESPGKSYYLHYVCYDSEGHSVATKQVSVKGIPTPDPDPDPDPPTDPPPEDLSDLKQVSDKGVATVNDPITATRLASAIRTSTRDTIKKKIDDVLLTRADAQRRYDWLGLWRKPVNEAIDKISNPDYAQIIPLLVTSLTPGSSQAFSKKVTLEVYIGTNCVYCDRWFEVEYPKCTHWNVEVKGTSGAGVVPWFKINNKTFVGYTPYEQLRTALE